jgi:hypothetical protein
MQTACYEVSNFRQLAEDVRVLFGPDAEVAATEIAKEHLVAGDGRGCMNWLQVIHALGGSSDLRDLIEPLLTERAFTTLTRDH